MVLVSPKLSSLLAVAVAVSHVAAFPSYGSLAGLSERELDKIVPTLPVGGFNEPPPGPLKDDRVKLVHDRFHPFQAASRDDIRGPCPGLNTLASHGYLPKNGVATPAQIIKAVQEGFNMENTLAVFSTYAAHLVDGNLVTNLLSIGGKTSRTGPDPPAPAIVGGLNTHSVFEGDASLTRADFHFGDNHSFNQTLFTQFVKYSKQFGGGFYNLSSAAELRWRLIQQSIATNPQFDFTSPRYFTAYAESLFPLNFMVDGRKNDQHLDMATAESFFKYNRFPKDFHRKASPGGTEGFDFLPAQHFIAPGKNVDGKVNNYVLDPTSADFSTFCLLYQNFVNKTVKSLYPNPKGILRQALNKNLDHFYSGLLGAAGDCAQVFPYGRD